MFSVRTWNDQAERFGVVNSQRHMCRAHSMWLGLLHNSGRNTDGSASVHPVFSWTIQGIVVNFFHRHRHL
jgi:hypothetical protein